MRGKVCYLFCRSTMRYDMEKIGRYEGKNKKFSFSPLISRFNFIHCCDLWAEQWMTCYTRNHRLSWRNERRSIHVRLLRVSWAMRGQNWSTDRKDVLKIVKSTKKWVFLKKIVGRQIFYRLRHRIFIINYICLLHRQIIKNKPGPTSDQKVSVSSLYRMDKESTGRVLSILPAKMRDTSIASSGKKGIGAESG